MDQIKSQGRLIRQRREALGLTQKELADLAGLTDQAVSNIERSVIHRPIAPRRVRSLRPSTSTPPP